MGELPSTDPAIPTADISTTNSIYSNDSEETTNVVTSNESDGNLGLFVFDNAHSHCLLSSAVLSKSDWFDFVKCFKICLPLCGLLDLLVSLMVNALFQ